MHGGLILTNPEFSGCQSLIHLIQKANNIELIANTGTGILFRLTVSNNNSIYANASGIKVNSFIIKIVIITDVIFEYGLGNRIGRNAKRTETFTDVLNESRVQQQIWIDCFEQGLPEFTPSVANLSIFDNAQSRNFLNLLRRQFEILYPRERFHTPDGGKLIPNIIEILTNGSLIYNQPPNIGVLLMPDIRNTITLKECLRSNVILNKLNAYENTIVNILRLYLFHDIIHLDLHTENVLISNDDYASSFIIDFGYITNSGSNNNSKKRKLSKRDIDVDNFNNMNNNNTDIEKIKFVEGIIQFVQDINIAKHNENHENDSSENHEAYRGIKWINDIDSNNKGNIFLNAFNKLKYIDTHRNKNQYLNGNIFKLNDDKIKTYYCTIEGQKKEPPKQKPQVSNDNPFSNEKCQNNSFCTISGGKRRTYVSKRKRKHKTQKNKKQETRKTKR